jgi:hypothetical protein
MRKRWYGAPPRYLFIGPATRLIADRAIRTANTACYREAGAEHGENGPNALHDSNPMQPSLKEKYVA